MTRPMASGSAIPLVSMMTDELLVGRYRRYLDRLVDLARRETEENLFTGEVVETWVRHARPAGRPL